MDQEAARKAVKGYLNEADNKIFDDLVERLDDTLKITHEEMIEGSVQLTELLDKNKLQIVAAPNRDKRNSKEWSLLELFVLHKGVIIQEDVSHAGDKTTD
ncbi:hypothetical protein KAR91_56695 [Candidatus Pacearchaeota archaeon]|nr:hypothetical protein [Candidatus Pacearchaeota archaeon]